MKLEEAINHCKEVAKSKCDSCGAEHEQLAKWLIELKERRESNKHVSNYEAGYDNRCDKLFGKNGELVEYREKQVLEGAFGIIRRHYEDKPNKIEAIAKLFGKKLGEVFSVEFVKGSLGRNRNFASCCYFKADGLFCEDRGPCEIMLNDLLTGKAVLLDNGEKYE